ncbi:MAG: nicotinate phosphoribosyltransferase [Deltaproteobacteria bacterium]|nr:nicotinate phosphoribosyltransferase [Deltaproteobacteria bacterium]
MDHREAPWVTQRTLPLLADLYAFTMLEAYLREGLEQEAVFSVFARQLAPTRSYALACGLEQVLDQLEQLSFDGEAVAFLRSLSLFSERTLAYLERLRFTGDVFAMAEGTPFFASEPILEVVAPLPQAQLLEAWVLNQLHVQSLAASKAARVVHAAAGRTVVDFGLRRTQGADAAIKVARGAYLAGAHATSNVLAGRFFGIPVVGTMAHSYVQAHPAELDAFRAFVRAFPEAVLLVDTYDTPRGVREVIRLARELGAAFKVSAVRLDSGDMFTLSREARRLLDEAGLKQVGIFASGGLDEHEVARLVKSGAPITGFGVGTALGVSDDAPSLDLVYKLVAYAGTDRTKLSPSKVLLPGRKQVFRVLRDGRVHHDVLAGDGEVHPGEPLLRQVMRNGRRCDGGPTPLAELRRATLTACAALPERIQALSGAGQPYVVEVSEALNARLARARHALQAGTSGAGA